MKSLLASLFLFFVAGITQSGAQEVSDDYFYLFNSTPDSVFVFTRSVKPNRWSLPVVAKPKELTRISLRDIEPLDLVIARKDGVYFVAKGLPLVTLVREFINGDKYVGELTFVPAQEITGRLEYDELEHSWKVVLRSDIADVKHLSLLWEDIKYDPPRKPKLPPRK